MQEGQSKDERYLEGTTALLSSQGRQFSQRLRGFVDEMAPSLLLSGSSETLRVWTSTTERSKRTAQEFPRRTEWKALGDLNPGVCDGLTDEEIAKSYPDEYAEHLRNPYNHRYPRAEVWARHRGLAAPKR